MREYLLQEQDRAALGSMKWQLARPGEIPLWVADMDFPPPEAVTRALQDRIGTPYYPYTLVPRELKAAFAAWCRSTQDWDPARGALGVTGGVLFAMSSAVAAFTAPGDAILVQTPVYPPFMNIPQALGRRLVTNSLADHGPVPAGGTGPDGAGRFAMDLTALDQAARDSGARMLFLCSPHNPVGRVWSRGELLELAALCRRHDLVVVADEIHADLVAPGQDFVSVARLVGGMGPGLEPDEGFDPDRTLVIQAPSKTFNIPGLGLGLVWAARDATLATLTGTIGRLGQSTVNIMSLVAARAAYETGGPWLAAVKELIQENAGRLQDWVAGQPELELAPRQGTYLAWIRTARAQARLGLDGTAFQQWLREQAGVYLSPGPQFGPGGEGWIRLNLGCAPSLLAEALGRLETALSGQKR